MAIVSPVELGESIVSLSCHVLDMYGNLRCVTGQMRCVCNESVSDRLTAHGSSPYPRSFQTMDSTMSSITWELPSPPAMRTVVSATSST